MDAGGAGAVHRPFAALGKNKANAKAAASAPAVARRPANEGPAGGSGEEPASFRQVMHGVARSDSEARRLPKAAALVDVAEPERQRFGPDPDDIARASLAALVVEGIRFEVTDDGVELWGRRLDTDPREIRRLRQRQYPVDGRLDLHGDSATAAEVRVRRFLSDRAAQGDRAVLIIFGRGSHSVGGRSVLRGEIGAWLSQGASARFVRAFVGDEGGAVLVLLTKG